MENISLKEVEALKKSHGRLLCSTKGDFIEDFYKNFVESNSRIDTYFQNIDMENQYKMMRGGINAMVMYISKYFSGESILQRVKHTHSLDHMNIPVDLYFYWKISFLKTLRQFDPMYDENIKNIWSKVIDVTIKFITTDNHIMVK